MRIAILCSNALNIDEHARKGTEIFCYTLLTHLTVPTRNHGLEIIAFASGASSLPMPIESIANEPSAADPQINAHGKHIMYELALLGHAFSKTATFNLYHVNMGDGDIALPFAQFVRTPIIITLHHLYDAEHTRRYFALFQNLTHVSFVSISNAQRRIVPHLNYAATIHHGVEENRFTFHSEGGMRIMWAGRLIPEKGADHALEIAAHIGQEIALFGIQKQETAVWFETLQMRIASLQNTIPISCALDRNRFSLATEYQHSKLFLFPVAREEDFGLTVIESMASGTPVVTYARGAMPELIEDGVTGFLVNPSAEDIRGHWHIKESGIAGLEEAVKRIYAMSDQQYRAMRLACRNRVEQHFTADRMAEEYTALYQRLAK